MYKVLHIVGGMNQGGTETYLMNIYRNIDRNIVQFDFLTYYANGESGVFDTEIIRLGGEIKNIPSISKSGFLNFLRDIRNVIHKGNYNAVHAHTTYNIGFSMLAAKLEGIPIRIAHSHNTGIGKNQNLLHKIYQKSMRLMINNLANYFCACSLKAAEHLFEKKNIQNNYTYMPNAVNLDRFISNDFISSHLKEKIDIPLNAKIIGHVGRYGKAKNHSFIIEMFYELLKERDDVYLVLIGDGASRYKIEEQIEELGIKSHVRVLGTRTDVDELMSIMNLFILPSLYEGFGIVLLEAQASGLPCVVSENIQPEPDLHLGLMHWVNLDNKDKWIEVIEENLNKKIEDKELIYKAIENSPCQLDDVVDKFYDLYQIGK